MSNLPPVVSEGGPTMTPADDPLPPLCSLTDVAARLMRALTDVEADAAPLFIDDVSALIRRYTGQAFSMATTTDVIILRADGRALLTQRPVGAVSYVAILNPDMSETPITGWWWDGLDVIRAGWDGSLMVNAPERWLDESPDTIKVTYSHGYTQVPPEVVGVAAAVVIRRITEPPAHLKELAVGRFYREMYYDAQSPGSVYLTADDKVALKDFRAVNNTIRLT